MTFETRLAAHRQAYNLGRNEAADVGLNNLWGEYADPASTCWASYRLGRWHRMLYGPEKESSQTPLTDCRT